MSQKGLSMRKIEEILRLKFEAGLSHRAITQNCSVSPSMVSEYVTHAKAAGRGVRFQIVINRYSPAAEEFRTLFDPIEEAEVIKASDNAIPLQGLSDREVVTAFPAMESYTAVLVRDKYFVLIVNNGFDLNANRHNQPVG